MSTLLWWSVIAFKLCLSGVDNVVFLIKVEICGVD